MKLRKTTIILLIVCILGLSLLLYPSVSDYWNDKHATKAINTYLENVNDIKENDSRRMLNEAVEYNRSLAKHVNDVAGTEEILSRYNDVLNVTDAGIMGVIDIPKIDVTLPIYHGTEEKVLQIAIGHIGWTSLPVGGEGSHCVVSGHRGLSRAKLFTDLDKLREGDTFTVSVLDEVLTYEVDQIRIVLPSETSNLAIEKGKDLFTLVTCTPYGVNTHRLLVRGHRIETAKEGATVISEAVKISSVTAAIAIALPFVFILLMVVILKKPKKKTTVNNLEKADSIVHGGIQSEKTDN